MVLGVVVSAWAQDFSVSAQVDKTTVDVGDPVNLVIKLSGDLAGVQVPVFQFPDGLAVLGRSQSTSISVQGNKMQRSVELLYVLAPQHDGTFELGPFKMTRGKQEVDTQPIAITVKKPVLPPHLSQPQGGRYSL